MSRSTLPAPASHDTGKGPVVPGPMFPIVGRILGFCSATVEHVRSETPTIRVLRLTPPQDYEHRAGQHAVVRIETSQGPDLRPLSIASAPGAGTIEFATRISSSSFKEAFSTLRPGDAVDVSRPFGRVHLLPGLPAIMVVGGIGITPVRSMLVAARLADHHAPIRLIFSNSTVEEIPFRAELDALSCDLRDLHVTHLVSNAPAGDLPEGVTRGRVDSDLLSQHLDQLPGAVVYVTGPARMVAEVRTSLRRMGVASSRIRVTRQTMPGTGPARAGR